MAGLDGIRNRIEPMEPIDKDLYELPPEEAKNIPQVPGSLEAVSYTHLRDSRVRSPRTRRSPPLRGACEGRIEASGAGRLEVMACLLYTSRCV